jgi:hypothetical protein
MKISTPSKRAYYPASENERDQLLCWIPEEELQRMVRFGQITPDVLEDYPDGLEFEVTQAAFDEFEIDLGVSPEAIQEAYAYHRERGEIPETGAVDGAALESAALDSAAQESLRGGPEMLTKGGPAIGFKFPEPEMTEGEDPRTVMLGLK